MDLEANKTLVRRYLEDVWTGADPAGVAAVLAPDYVLYTEQRTSEGTKRSYAGPEGMRHAIAMYRTAFPDLRITVDRLVAEGDQVAAEWTATGTHQGAFRAIPPTGNPVRYAGVGFYRIAGGQIAEEHYFGDRLGLWQQLGVVSATRELVHELES